VSVRQNTTPRVLDHTKQKVSTTACIGREIALRDPLEKFQGVNVGSSRKKKATTRVVALHYVLGFIRANPRKSVAEKFRYFFVNGSLFAATRSTSALVYVRTACFPFLAAMEASTALALPATPT
jgi:hypothetical protein